MTIAVVVLSLTLAGVIAAATLALLRRSVAGPRLTGKTVVVNTLNDTTVRGIVAADHRDRLTLSEALFVTGRDEQLAGGLIHIPRERVATIQEPEA